MPSSFRRVVGSAGALAAALCLAVPAALAEAPVGIGAAVNPQTLGTPPAGVPRPFFMGQPIIFNERIATTASGQAQIVFRDQSALTVGPSSDLVIDRFVYDPQAHAGKLTMSATRGVLRFVGGEISKLDGGVTLATPAGSIGIRGGVFLAWLAPDGSTTAIFLYGTGLSVTGRGGATTRVAYPGLAVTVDRTGVPSAPFTPPPGYVAALMAQFDGTAGPTIAAEEIQGRLAASPVLAQLAPENRLWPSASPGFPPRNTPLDPVPFRSDFQINSVAPQGDAQLQKAISSGAQRSRY